MKSPFPILLIALALVFSSVLVTQTGDASDVAAKKKKGKKAVKIPRLGSRYSATLLFNGGIPDTWSKLAGNNKPPKYLQWPMPGRRLGRGFGSDNGRHKAVDITAPIGTSVHVMAPGIVGYADNGVRGYGNMVMVLHSGGWVSLYAHLDKFRVKPGDWVKRSQVVALSGNTGISRGPHLHFALIDRGKARDPMKFMRGGPQRPKRVSQLMSDYFTHF